MSKKSKKKSEYAKVSQQIISKIPYQRVFEDEGIFESAPGVFSKAYVIQDITTKDIKSFSNDMIAKRFAMLLNDLPASMTLQFIIHNRLIGQDVFLKKILMVPDKEETVNEWIETYNKTVTDNSTIGHNNVKKNKYFVISMKADIPEEAVNAFRKEDENIKNLFAGICNINVEGLSAVARLRVMYSMFNPKLNDFGKKADVKGDGTFTLKTMSKLKLTTKDCIKPFAMDTTNKNYIVLNNDTYVRLFFITSIPAYVSNNLISDITNISSNMVFSTIYEPVDSQYGFEVATQRVSNNTIIKQQMKRDTIKDRKDKTIVKTETMINESEQKYFEKSALRIMKESVAVGEKAMLATFVIALYADDLETLERDTKLLHISTSKFACQVKPLDLQQLQGLQTVLPLAYNRVDCRRMFTIRKLSAMPPLNLQEVLQKDGLFNGLNSINDNLILLNRKNNPTLSGIIAGTEHSGKTFQNKREIFNSLISTKDKVLIVSNNDNYDNFVKALGGKIYTNVQMNPMRMVEHYGLVNPDKYSKSLYLEALIEVLTRSTEKIISSQNIAAMTELENATSDRYDKIVEEVDSFFKSVEQAGIDWQDVNATADFIIAHKDTYPNFYDCVDFIKDLALNRTNIFEDTSRLQLVKFTTDAEAIVLLDYLFNKQIDYKIDNKTTWLFVDSIDGLFDSEQTSNFLTDYVERMNALQNIYTQVIQSSVELFTDNATSYRLKDLIYIMGYFKLLNQGAIERRRFAELLNIPNSLVNYITSAELGKGIICTASSNIAFDDSFYMDDSSDTSVNFYKLFQL